MVKRLLILGGTTEAASLAQQAEATFGDNLEIISSLAGRLPPRQKLPGEVRIGGFGGTERLAIYLRGEEINYVIDATHPFAATISAHCAEACATTGTARLMIVRPPWTREAGDEWIDAADMDNAALLAAKHGQRVFLATGIGSLAAFGGIADVWFLIRLFEVPVASIPIDRYTVIVDRPPFTVDAEVKLLRDNGIDTLVSKQSGGPTSAKLRAARKLGLPVIMVRRPILPEGPTVATPAAAIEWLADRI
jgi:precorrin-6A/cobalt-precorrin-6A reductase